MHVIWKRPDGYWGASPNDYYTVELDSRSRLWLHKTDKDSYPFRISGGWEEKESSRKLNNLINLIGHDRSEWLGFLSKLYSHTMKDDRKTFFESLTTWLSGLTQHLKGDSWEIEIVEQAIHSTLKQLDQVRESFLADTKPD